MGAVVDVDVDVVVDVGKRRSDCFFHEITKLLQNLILLLSFRNSVIDQDDVYNVP